MTEKEVLLKVKNDLILYEEIKNYMELHDDEIIPSAGEFGQVLFYGATLSIEAMIRINKMADSILKTIYQDTLNKILYDTWSLLVKHFPFAVIKNSEDEEDII